MDFREADYGFCSLTSLVLFEFVLSFDLKKSMCEHQYKKMATQRLVISCIS